MQLNKILNNIKPAGRINNFFKWFNKHPSLFLLFILLADSFVCWIFYSKYYLEIDSKTIETSAIVKLDINSLNRFSGGRNARQEVLNSLPNKQYPDYFSLNGERNINMQTTTSKQNQEQSTTSETEIR